MEIEFDPVKDLANLRKHGVSLSRAAEIDFGADQVAVRPDLRRDYGEPRWLAYAILDRRLHVFAFTMRGDRVRAISLRRANSREAEAYGKAG